ncbi:hypothetical protein J7M28_02650 [bacterium]|nr:hypothetical protein [bacterium]
MKGKEQDYPTRDTSLIGAAGVHFVVSELSLRGLIALPTIRNTAGVDVVVTNKSGTWHANLQVKCSRSRVGFWPIGEKYNDWVGANNYYVFVRYSPNTGSLEAFLVSSADVARNAGQGLEYAKEKGLKWVPCFYPKKEDLDGLKDKWDGFGKGFAS